MMIAARTGSRKSMIMQPVSNCDPRQVRRLEEKKYEERARERAREKELAKLMRELPDIVRKDRRAERRAAWSKWKSEPMLQIVSDDNVAVQTPNSAQEGGSQARADPAEHFRFLCSQQDEVPFAQLRKQRLIKMKTLSYRLKKGFDLILGRDYPEPLKDDWSIWLGHGWRDRIPSWEFEDDSDEAISNDSGESNNKRVSFAETGMNEQEEGVVLRDFSMEKARSMEKQFRGLEILESSSASTQLEGLRDTAQEEKQLFAGRDMPRPRHVHRTQSTSAIK
jgi:hypothetical protein